MSIAQRICLVALFSIFHVGFVSAQNRTENNRLTDYDLVMKTIASTRVPNFFGNTDAADWMLLATVRPPFGESELVLGLAKLSSGSARLVVLRPYPVSVLQQMQTRRRMFADGKNVSKIKLSSFVVDSDKCGLLSQMIAKWEEFDFPIVPRNELLLDATGYDFEFRNRYGGKLATTLEGGKLANDRSPIVRLLNETYTACT